jgi:hypothetical protein
MDGELIGSVTQPEGKQVVTKNAKEQEGHEGFLYAFLFLPSSLRSSCPLDFPDSGSAA